MATQLGGLAAVVERIAQSDTLTEGELRELLRTGQQAIGAATQSEKDRATVRLAPLIKGRFRLDPAAGLALLAGCIVEEGGRADVVGDAILWRASEVFEGAVRFVHVWRELSHAPVPEPGDLPSTNQALQRELFRRDASAAQAWWYLSRFAYPTVAVLSAAPRLRSAIPRRDTLLRCSEELEPHWAYMGCVRKALRVVDEEIVVVHRASGRGFRVRLSGVSDNWQLYTLLAGLLVGPQSAGRLPGEAIPDEWYRAAIDGPVEEAPVVWARFALSMHTGEPVQPSGVPADIARLGAVRVVVMDRHPFNHGWTGHRYFPGMVAHIGLTAELGEGEAEALLARCRPMGPQWTEPFGVV